MAISQVKVLNLDLEPTDKGFETYVNIIDLNCIIANTETIQSLGYTYFIVYDSNDEIIADSEI